MPVTAVLSKKFYEKFGEDVTSTQVFPWTEAELAQRLADNDPFAREILGTGQPLAGSSKWP